jgi:hypothetical protein
LHNIEITGGWAFEDGGFSIAFREILMDLHRRKFVEEVKSKLGGAE